MSGGREARRSWGNEGGNRATDAGLPLPPHMTECYRHVVDMAKENPAQFIPSKMG